MGRRWGKTVFGEVIEITFSSRGAKVAWVVPSYKNGRPLWRMVRRVLAPLKALGLVRINETDRIVEFDDSVGGGFLGMYTGEDNCDAMRGEDFDIVVVDEAAKLKEAAINDAIMPTLADRNGKLVLISTPRGRNWFWRLWMLGQDYTQSAIRSFTAPSSDNPNLAIRRAAELAKTRVSDRTYRQEWLAEFLEDGGGVFHDVRAVVDSSISLETTPKWGTTKYVIGLDLAKHRDFTALVVFNLDEKRVVAFQRFNKESWPLIEARVALAAKTWNDALIWMDATGVGDPEYDRLQRMGLRVQGFKITDASRMALLEHAVLCTEQRAYRLPADPALDILLAEMEAMEYIETSTHRLRPDHPDGMHDDTVFALALALWPMAMGGALPRAALDALTAHISDERAAPVSFESIVGADVRGGLLGGRRL